MRVLLGSGGFRTDERRVLLAGEMRQHFGAIGRLLFVPYALADHDGYLRLISERGLDGGYSLDGIHTYPDPKKAIREAEGLFVGGGNTFRLLSELYRLDLLDVIRQGVRERLPYLGISAGSNVACPTMQTTNDMPIVQPPSFAALGLVRFQINAHYYTGMNWVKHGETLIEHFGETRDDRLREFHEMNDTPVVGLWEAGVLLCDDATVQLHDAPARLFRKGQPCKDLEPGSLLPPDVVG